MALQDRTIVPARETWQRIPPHAWFLVSALFHYLGPSFAVLLFGQIAPTGMAWLRIASAGLIFVLWRRPRRVVAALRSADRLVIVGLGIVLAAMNTVFYEAIARLPLATVGAIEFLGPIAVAAAGVRTRRNLAALVLAILGIYLLTEIRLAGEAAGYRFAFVNCALFVLYILLGHRIAADRAGAADPTALSSIDRLAAAMLVATVASLPLGIKSASVAFGDPVLLAAAAGVGLSSSVIPYVCDQLAMARLPRASFALMLSLLPATATAVGFLVLHQQPGIVDLLGIGLVGLGVALHRPT